MIKELNIILTFIFNNIIQFSFSVPPSTVVIKKEDGELVKGTVGPYPLHGEARFICEVTGGQF